MNIIRLNMREIDKLSEIARQDGFVAETYNIINQNKFPLYQINYLFDINVGKIQANTVIRKEAENHIFEVNAYKNGKYIGVVGKIVLDIDPLGMIFPKQTKTSCKKQDKPLLELIGELVFSTTMAVFYTMSHAEKVVGKMSKKNSRKEKGDDCIAVIHRKINTYVRKNT